MGETASSSRTNGLSPTDGDMGGLRAQDTPSTASRAVPLTDDQPTIISSQLRITSPSISDSAYRIFQGKILPGDRLGHFELERMVGGGGMGRVFRALDTRLGRTVALKILPPDQAADHETLARFHNEAQSAARLDHANITRVYYQGEDRGLTYIVFEFVEGVNIRALVEQKGTLPLDEAISYTLQVAEALTHASRQDVVHRDIKPSNVLITPEGHVKLIDMGLARMTRVDTSAEDLTASGVTLGTFDYISPEQARDPRNADIRSDIYSLGCTFFYMLTGRPPFPEGTVLQKLLQHQGDQPPDVRQFRPDLPEEVARVLRKMLAKDPRRRYPDSEELVGDLMVLAEQIGMRPVVPGSRVYAVPREPKVSFFQRHLPWIAPITALVVIVLLLEYLSRGESSAIPPAGAPPSLERTQTPASASQPAAAPAVPLSQSPSGSQSGGASPVPGPVDPSPEVAGGAATDAILTAEPAAGEGLSALDQLLATRFSGGGLRGDALGAGMSAGDDSPWLLEAFPEVETVSAELTGAAAAATEPTADDPPAAPNKRGGILIVGEGSEGDDAYPTLAAACAAAANGDIVELHYNGRREIAEEPIKLANLRLTIRSGKDYRPVVVFRPDGVDPVKYPCNMFTVSSGRLTLSDLAVELVVPRDVPAKNWALFQTRGAQTIWLENCSVTIRNASDRHTAYHPDVACFRSAAAPGTASTMAETNPVARPAAVIDLVDCVVRGEATLLAVEDLQPVHLVWENGLLATTERLLSVSGGPRAAAPGELLQVDLRYLTAAVRGGFCRFADGRSQPHRLPAQVYCADNIILGTPGVALIEQVGAGTLDDYQKQLSWSGDRNFYEDIDVFWRIGDPAGKDLAVPKDFEAWKTSKDETQPELDEVQWLRPPRAERPLSSHTTSDYTSVDSSDTNPAYNAGFQVNQLPELPPDPPAAAPTPAAESTVRVSR